MIKIEDIESAIDNLQVLIINQLKNGNQTKELKDNFKDKNYFALGQFIYDTERSQRGIHGSASGLRVISDSTESTYISGLIEYITHRETIENHLKPDESYVQRVKRDNKNIIKISEVLYSLSFVKPGNSPKDELYRILSEKLVQSFIEIDENNKGWGYFEKDKEIQLFPTSFAYLVQTLNGINTKIIRSYLLKKAKEYDINSPSSLAILSFVLYVLVKTEKNNQDKKDLKIIFNKIWKSNYCQLDDDIEQNIEYWHNSEHEYVRIPWQLYLISSSLIVSPTKFFSSKVQERLNSAILQAKDKGLIYQHSGSKTSTRTNSILYDNLIFIKTNYKNTFIYYILYYYNNIIDILGSKLVKYILILIVSIVCSFSAYKWFQSGDSLKDIGGTFITTILLSIFSFVKKK